jgi:alpha-ketoglutarate-dependent taurine dioxygenase
MTTTTPFTVQRTSAALGAVLTGLDLAAGVDDATLGAIQRAFLAYKVIVIRGQSAVTPAGQLDFAARWGEISVHPYGYRHRWQLGDLVIWDNRCTQHAVVGDAGGQERVLHRVTLLGDIPV